MSLLTLVAVCFGGSMGAITRAMIKQLFRGNFPWWTLIANISGSFLAGLYFFTDSPEWWHVAFIGGYCGSLTTFSTLALETAELHQHESHIKAIANILLNLIAPFFAVAFAHYLTTFFA